MALTKLEQKILRGIRVASENNPLLPEFPADNPKFPATPTYKIKVPGFTNVWLKDESKNATGTHKDRMAWEVIVTYRNILLAKKRGEIKKPLPAMSIISSGSAALAIQTQLRKYHLPSLRVLLDVHIPDNVIRDLEAISCNVYRADLSKKPLTSREILEKTRNKNGFDITCGEAFDPATRFYDWLSYEIINNSPDYCFIPFGTGNLFENILNINKREVSTIHHDPRFLGNVSKLRTCNFMGATTNDPRSTAIKLYSPHLPFVHFDEQWIKLYKESGFCGPESNIYLIKESYLKQAMSIAEEQGIDCEPSGIAGLALMLQMRKRLPRNKKMLIVNTGKVRHPNITLLK